MVWFVIEEEGLVNELDLILDKDFLDLSSLGSLEDFLIFYLLTSSGSVSVPPSTKALVYSFNSSSSLSSS